jgi:predicted transcriptional regulator
LPVALPQSASRILAELQVRGTTGGTCDELEQAMGLSHQTCSARLRELNMKNRIYDSGKRRKTRSGRDAIVWFAVEGMR